MSEMVERVARAIYESKYPDGSWEKLHPNRLVRKARLEEAAAAIKALREPTGAMLKAGTKTRDEWFAEENMESNYQAMIDEALK